MGKKSDAREQRRAESQRKFDRRKAEALANAQAQQQPRIELASVPEGGPRVAPHLERAMAQSPAEPKAPEGASRFASPVTWCITRADQDGAWSWKEERAWSANEFDAIIAPAFLQFARISWGEVDQLTSGTGHKMHHAQEIGSLVDEAQNRWLERGLEEYDSVFRFRLGATRRAWGYIVQSHFRMVWWDRYHSIYPTEQG